MLTLPHLGKIETKSWEIAESLRAMMNAINNHARIVGVDPTGTYPAPTALSSIAVTSVAGGFDVALTDANPQRGVHYFVEFDTMPNFPAPRTVPLLSTRNVYLPLVTGTYYFRAYAQFIGSNPSAYTVFGGATPQSVAGGAAGTPVLGATQGTGSTGPTGASPNPPVGSGFGTLSQLPPPRNLPGGRVGQ